jgi:hypothetical protein
MPPTDLDVVDVLSDLPPIDDDVLVERVVVIPPSDDEVEGVDEGRAPAPEASDEPEEYDVPTGPISLRARPQPSPSGAQSSPSGGPPAP